MQRVKPRWVVVPHLQTSADRHPMSPRCIHRCRWHPPVAFGGAGGDSKGYSVRAAQIAVRERPYSQAKVLPPRMVMPGCRIALVISSPTSRGRDVHQADRAVATRRARNTPGHWLARRGANGGGVQDIAANYGLCERTNDSASTVHYMNKCD